jgi:hypothetical protein
MWMFTGSVMPTTSTTAQERLCGLMALVLRIVNREGSALSATGLARLAAVDAGVGSVAGDAGRQ